MASSLLTADTSVVIPLLASWHDAHQPVLRPMRHVARLPSHVLLETFSGLARMPHGLAVPPRRILEVLRARFTEPLALPEDSLWLPLEAVVTAGLAGGQVYDALIAATAHHAGARLLTRDRRAERVYRAIGVDFEMLD